MRKQPNIGNELQLLAGSEPAPTLAAYHGKLGWLGSAVMGDLAGGSGLMGDLVRT